MLHEILVYMMYMLIIGQVSHQKTYNSSGFMMNKAISYIHLQFNMEIMMEFYSKVDLPNTILLCIKTLKEMKNSSHMIQSVSIFTMITHQMPLRSKMICFSQVKALLARVQTINRFHWESAGE